MSEVKLVLVTVEGTKRELSMPTIGRAVAEAETRMTRNVRSLREVRITDCGKIVQRWTAYTQWRQQYTLMSVGAGYSRGHE